MSSAAPGATWSTRFRALRHRNFRLFWYGQLVSVVGTWMQAVAQLWLMHRLTDSAFMLGLLGFIQLLPVMPLTLWAGVIADRMDKRRLITITQALSLVQAALLAVVVSLGVVQPWMVLVLAFVFGTVSAFDLPARQSFLVDLVGKEDLPNAIALNSAAFNAARVVGPAVAGIVLAAAGEATCFWVNAVSYLAVVVVLMRMNLPPRVADAESPGPGALREGIAYALSVPSIRNLLILLGITSSLGFQYTVLLPVYARDILHADEQAYGLMTSAFGLGSLLSGVLMTRKQDRWALRRNLLIGLGTSALGMAGFAWSRQLPLTMVMGFLAGFGLILYVATTNTLLQLTTEDRFRGRLMGLYTFMFIGTAPVGSLLAGEVAQHWGAPIATSISAFVLFGGAVWVFFRLRVLAAREAAQAVPAFTEKMG
ncbi:MAG TPA: MFS transporter [Candidatus Eisenbacteria bacterium]|nr:MFS transporter [Candidatus Eisenbacteria bacterium]